MVMKWLDTIFQDKMLAIKCLRVDTPTMVSSSFFLFLMDLYTITSGTLSLSCISKERNPMGCTQVSRGQGVPPQALDDMHPILVSSHSITILVWFGLLWFGTSLLPHSFSLLGYPQGLNHGRKDLVLQQLPIAYLVDPLICMLIYV
jgi:hypothetical protein